MNDQYRITIGGVVRQRTGHWESPVTDGFYEALTRFVFADKWDGPDICLKSDGTLIMSNTVTLDGRTTPQAIGDVEQHFAAAITAANPHVTWQDRSYEAEPVKERT